MQDDADGGYAGFDAEELTSRSGGKLKVAQHLKVCCGNPKLRPSHAAHDACTVPFSNMSLLDAHGIMRWASQHLHTDPAFTP